MASFEITILGIRSRGTSAVSPSACTGLADAHSACQRQQREVATIGVIGEAGGHGGAAAVHPSESVGRCRRVAVHLCGARPEVAERARASQQPECVTQALVRCPSNLLRAVVDSGEAYGRGSRGGGAGREE